MTDDLLSLIARLEERMLNLTKAVADLSELIKSDYATRLELKNLKEMVETKLSPIRAIVFSAVGIILISVFTAMTYLVIRK